ncbi:arginine--tRNA ligase [bacterium]|nr:arginine--tRNA ligase [bacterium]
MLEVLKIKIQEYLNKRVNEEMNLSLSLVVENPKDKTKGDIAIPSFQLSKILHKSPMEIAPLIKNYLEELDYFEKIECVGPYVNAFYSREKLIKLILDNVDSIKEKNDPKGVILIDYSSPNIAKNFSIGHLRSTILGQSIGNIFEYLNYKVVRINHLGDFGTQFGKLIYAYLNWGDKEKVMENPISELVSLYVKFHEEAEKDPSLDDKAREIFNELEEGNPKYRALWSSFKDASLKEFKRIYDLLGVTFDEYSSEASASRDSNRVLSLLDKKNLLEIDNGATIIRIGDDIPPAIVKRSDGATLYITRDLEEIHRRYDKYHFDQMLYCVGNEQKLYFNQLKRVLKRMDAPFKDSVTHVNFGLILTGGKKMSTRHGNAIGLNEVLNESIRLAKEHIQEKNDSLDDKDEIAKNVGVSAIIFNDLKNYHENDYEFNLEDATRFEGQTGPYLQYTSVRISSILKQSDFDKDNISFELLSKDDFFEIVKKLDEFDVILEKCKEEYAPNYLAKYLLQLASLFNSFYSKEKCLVDDIIERNTKLYLIYLIKSRLDLGMKLLGMKLVDKM